MKVSNKSVKFSPVTIELTFETKNELAMFFALFNHTTLTEVEAENGLEPTLVRRVIGSIDYESQQTQLENAIRESD